jgi:uncharacterized phage infection (PIP) family protein YhgE
MDKLSNTSESKSSEEYFLPEPKIGVFESRRSLPQKIAAWAKTYLLSRILKLESDVADLKEQSPRAVATRSVNAVKPVLDELYAPKAEIESFARGIVQKLQDEERVVEEAAERRRILEAQTAEVSKRRIRTQKRLFWGTTIAILAVGAAISVSNYFTSSTEENKRRDNAIASLESTVLNQQRRMEENEFEQGVYQLEDEISDEARDIAYETKLDQMREIVRANQSRIQQEYERQFPQRDKRIQTLEAGLAKSDKEISNLAQEYKNQSTQTSNEIKTINFQLRRLESETRAMKDAKQEALHASQRAIEGYNDLKKQFTITTNNQNERLNALGEKVEELVEANRPIKIEDRLKLGLFPSDQKYGEGLRLTPNIKPGSQTPTGRRLYDF